MNGGMLAMPAKHKNIYVSPTLAPHHSAFFSTHINAPTGNRFCPPQNPWESSHASLRFPVEQRGRFAPLLIAPTGNRFCPPQNPWEASHASLRFPVEQRGRFAPLLIAPTGNRFCPPQNPWE